MSDDAGEGSLDSTTFFVSRRTSDVHGNLGPQATQINMRKHLEYIYIYRLFIIVYIRHDIHHVPKVPFF